MTMCIAGVFTSTASQAEIFTLQSLAQNISELQSTFLRIYLDQEIRFQSVIQDLKWNNSNLQNYVEEMKAAKESAIEKQLHDLQKRNRSEK